VAIERGGAPAVKPPSRAAGSAIWSAGQRLLMPEEALVQIGGQGGGELIADLVAHRQHRAVELAGEHSRQH
jgi:hypothetical protein